MLVKLDHFPKFQGGNSKKKMSCHHLLLMNKSNNKATLHIFARNVVVQPVASNSSMTFSSMCLAKEKKAAAGDTMTTNHLSTCERSAELTPPVDTAIPSMYGIFTYIWLLKWQNIVNVGKYTIHGCYGTGYFLPTDGGGWFKLFSFSGEWFSDSLDIKWQIWKAHWCWLLLIGFEFGRFLLDASSLSKLSQLAVSGTFYPQTTTLKKYQPF